jgi:fused signal recognition particle receptor
MPGFLKKSASGPASESSTSQERSWLGRLKNGLARTGSQLSSLFTPGGKIDDEFYEELETILITSDVGMDATRMLLADVRRQVKELHLTDAAQLKDALAHSLLKLLKPLALPLDIGNQQPFVIMMVGVNGAGKTTSIGKLAKYFQGQGKSVLLAPPVSSCWNGAHAIM